LNHLLIGDSPTNILKIELACRTNIAHKEKEQDWARN